MAAVHAGSPASVDELMSVLVMAQELGLAGGPAAAQVQWVLLVLSQGWLTVQAGECDHQALRLCTQALLITFFGLHSTLQALAMLCGG